LFFVRAAQAERDRPSHRHVPEQRIVLEDKADAAIRTSGFPMASSAVEVARTPESGCFQAGDRCAAA